MSARHVCTLVCRLLTDAIICFFFCLFFCLSMCVFLKARLLPPRGSHETLLSPADLPPTHVFFQLLSRPSKPEQEGERARPSSPPKRKKKKERKGARERDPEPPAGAALRPPPPSRTLIFAPTGAVFLLKAALRPVLEHAPHLDLCGGPESAPRQAGAGRGRKVYQSSSDPPRSLGSPWPQTDSLPGP